MTSRAKPRTETEDDARVEEDEHEQPKDDEHEQPQDDEHKQPQDDDVAGLSLILRPPNLHTRN